MSDWGTASGFAPHGPSLRVGRYQVVGKLATGGMAEVYLARHGEISGFQTLVVVKRILPHLGSDQQFIEMFLDEARIAARLDHPNVVRIVEVGRAGNEYFLAMDLVQGESLAETLRRGTKAKRPLPPTLAALIVANAAAGLQHAHTLCDVTGTELRVVHRDVSPQNVLISFEGAVKVIDFGVARALGRVTSTNTGGVKGKFGYMSPEQARGEIVDARSDIFALGVVLWEIVCARRLFKRETDLATLRAIVDEPVPRPSVHGDVSPVLESIIMRALEKDRDKRFASAHDMQQALEGYIYGAGRVGGADLARYMKEILADRHARWRDAIRTALEKGAAPPDMAEESLLGTPSMAGAGSLPARSGSRAGAAGVGGAVSRRASPPGTPGTTASPAAERAGGGASAAPAAGDEIHTIYAKGTVAAESEATSSVNRPSQFTPAPHDGGRRQRRRIIAGAAAGLGGAIILLVAVLMGGDAPRVNAPGPAAAAGEATPMIPPLTGVGVDLEPAPPAPTVVKARAPSLATLFVSTEPKSARIIIDGVVKAESTPTVLKLPPGEVKLRLEKEGHEPKIISLVLYAEQEKVVEEKLPRVRSGGRAGRGVTDKAPGVTTPPGPPEPTTPPPPAGAEAPARKPGAMKPNPFE